jgi:hypothetical protein
MLQRLEIYDNGFIKKGTKHTASTILSLKINFEPKGTSLRGQSRTPIPQQSHSCHTTPTHVGEPESSCRPTVPSGESHVLPLRMAPDWEPRPLVPSFTQSPAAVCNL